MKLSALFAPLAFGAAIVFTTAPVHAQTADPCAVYACMAGISGSGLAAGGGPDCTPATAVFFNIIIYDEEGIDFPATSLARKTYLMTCPGANTGDNTGWLNAIITEWGMVV